MDCAKLKTVACEFIDKCKDELHNLGNKLWEHPELSFEEVFAHDLLTNYLSTKGFLVEKSFLLSTAFRATIKDNGSHGGATIAVISEYDALPGIGHACGHNLIAEVGVGAALGIKAALEVLKLEQGESAKNFGKLIVLGTPAEEGGGGKIDLINGGAFADIDVAMMCHPAPKTSANFFGCLCRESVTVRYIGKASHGGASPWEGINALDAAVSAYNNVSCLRQQLKPTWRVLGIITKGGVKTNIIPEEAELRFSLRAPTSRDMKLLVEKATRCFNAAATSTGCQVEIQWDSKPYKSMIFNAKLEELFMKNASSLGVTFDPTATFSASTDMGDVSHVIPSIHPMYYIGDNLVNHTREFTAAAGDPKAQPYTIAQAKSLAMTAIDIFCQPSLLNDIKKEFEENLKKDQ